MPYHCDPAKIPSHQAARLLGGERASRAKICQFLFSQRNSFGAMCTHGASLKYYLRSSALFYFIFFFKNSCQASWNHAMREVNVAIHRKFHQFFSLLLFLFSKARLCVRSIYMFLKSIYVFMKYINTYLFWKVCVTHTRLRIVSN